MCFADIDHKTLTRETEDRLAGLSFSPAGEGLWTRIRKWSGRRFGPRTAPPPAVPAE